VLSTVLDVGAIVIVALWVDVTVDKTVVELALIDVAVVLAVLIEIELDAVIVEDAFTGTD